MLSESSYPGSHLDLLFSNDSNSALSPIKIENVKKEEESRGSFNLYKKIDSMVVMIQMSNSINIMINCVCGF